MSEFGGLRKQETTQHALVGMGSAALHRKGGPKCLKKIKQKNSEYNYVKMVPIRVEINADLRKNSDLFCVL